MRAAWRCVERGETPAGSVRVARSCGVGESGEGLRVGGSGEGRRCGLGGSGVALWRRSFVESVRVAGLCGGGASGGASWIRLERRGFVEALLESVRVAKRRGVGDVGDVGVETVRAARR